MLYYEKKNKLTTENQDTDKLGKLWSERKAFGQKWLATYIYKEKRMCITYYIRAPGIKGINNFATITQVQVTVNTF